MNSRNPVCRLLDMGASVKRLLPQTCGTPLLFAVSEEEPNIVRLLLKKSALPMQPGIIVKRRKKSYPLLLAAENKILGIIDGLLNAGAFVNQRDSKY